jgi:hypothetical protein
MTETFCCRQSRQRCLLETTGKIVNAQGLAAKQRVGTKGIADALDDAVSLEFLAKAEQITGNWQVHARWQERTQRIDDVKEKLNNILLFPR